jgi:alpha-tubulin suppressor-like RCC1 family protein
VYVLGANTYGQHGKEELSKLPADQLAMKVKKNKELAANEMGATEFTAHARPSLIKFPASQDKIVMVACGGEHLFAKTALDEIYGWGRNDEGQLGVGFLAEKIVEPLFLKDLSYKGIKQIACGDNYSAAVSMHGEVSVAGSLDGGKLGLGKGQRRGYQLQFSVIESLEAEIDYIACGVEHMLAISRYSPSGEMEGNKNQGKTYAWGRNQRG